MTQGKKKREKRVEIKLYISTALLLGFIDRHSSHRGKGDGAKTPKKCWNCLTSEINPRERWLIRLLTLTENFIYTDCERGPKKYERTYYSVAGEKRSLLCVELVKHARNYYYCEKKSKINVFLVERGKEPNRERMGNAERPRQLYSKFIYIHFLVGGLFYFPSNDE